MVAYLPIGKRLAADIGPIKYSQAIKILGKEDTT